MLKTSVNEVRAYVNASCCFFPTAGAPGSPRHWLAEPPVTKDGSLQWWNQKKGSRLGPGLAPTVSSVRQVEGRWLLSEALTLEVPSPPPPGVQGHANKAEERDCHSVAVTQKSLSNQLKGKQRVLPRTETSSGGCRGRRSASCGDTDR